MTKITITHDLPAGNYTLDDGADAEIRLDLTLADAAPIGPEPPVEQPKDPPKDPEPPVEPPAPPPAAGLAAAFTATLGEDGHTVTFADQSTGAAEVIWAWGDGGGITAGPGDRTHSYAKAGTYVAKQTVWSARRKQNAVFAVNVTTTVDVVVAPPPPTVLPPYVPEPVDLKTEAGDGPHAVVLTVVDGAGVAWTATAHVGDDAEQLAVYLGLANAAGELHPALTAWAYADCIEVGATRFDNPFDWLGFKSVAVTYDGADVPVPASSRADGTFDFWRGTRSPAIRYGAQVPWSAYPIDWSLLPSWRETVRPPYNDSKSDYSFNGLGRATTNGMGSGGSRDDIGYLPTWDLPFLSDPRDETWAVVRRADDYDGGWWGVFLSDPATGRIVDVNKYPGFAPLPMAQVGGYKSNPFAAYRGAMRGSVLEEEPNAAKSWNVTRNTQWADGPHLTGYALLAAMVTHSARDRDHVSFWTNFNLIQPGVPANTANGVAYGAQRRMAWGVRSLFIASYLSSDGEYFAAELERNRLLAEKYMTGPIGLYTNGSGSHSYPRMAVADGGDIGMAPWMQFYLQMALDPVWRKLPQWKPFAAYLAQYVCNFADKPYKMLVSFDGFIVLNTEADRKTQTLLTDFPDAVRRTLGPYMGWSKANVNTILSATDVPQVYAAVKAQQPTWGGKCVDGVSDLIGYLVASDTHSAMAVMAIVCAVNLGVPGADAMWDYVQRVPTKIDYRRNGQYDLVPRATEPPDAP